MIEGSIDELMRLNLSRAVAAPCDVVIFTTQSFCQEDRQPALLLTPCPSESTSCENRFCQVRLHANDAKAEIAVDTAVTFTYHVLAGCWSKL